MNDKTVITKYDDSSLVRSNDISTQLSANIVLNCFSEGNDSKDRLKNNTSFTSLLCSSVSINSIEP